MNQTTLYTKEGRKVTTILTPDWRDLPPDLIQWGGCMYILNEATDRYEEARRLYRGPADSVAQQANSLLDEVQDALLNAMEKHTTFNSFHEGYAVILEELEEYWAEVKRWPKNHNPAAMRTELLHTAAMCLRTIIDRKL
jgi:hypothetical protein